MKLEGNCQTTAMGIMPHTDVEKALELSLSLDIPYWPQLPRVSFYEDMYAQVSENFPGIKVDAENREIHFSLDKFYEDLEEVLENWENEEYFRLSPQYSVVYHKFLGKDLSTYNYIRGQTIGPVSYGLKIVDEREIPMIYYEEVRQIIFEFVAKKLQAQYNEMNSVHPRPFVWVDEPGLEMVFMAFTGYPNEKAFEDYHAFLEQFPGYKGVHLCGNPDWSFLLQLDLEVLSIDVLAWGHIFSRYIEDIKAFLQEGGIISWGITPTLSEEFELENVETMIDKLEEMWGYLQRSGISRQQILSQSWLAPARCCLINQDGGATVEHSFALLKKVSEHFKEEL